MSFLNVFRILVSMVTIARSWFLYFFMGPSFSVFSSYKRKRCSLQLLSDYSKQISSWWFCLFCGGVYIERGIFAMGYKADTLRTMLPFLSDVNNKEMSYFIFLKKFNFYSKWLGKNYGVGICRRSTLVYAQKPQCQEPDHWSSAYTTSGSVYPLAIDGNNCSTSRTISILCDSPIQNIFPHPLFK